MPLEIDSTVKPPVMNCSGIIAIEETDMLMEFFREYPDLVANLSNCEHIHTAPLQALKMLNIPVKAIPDEPFWKICLGNLTKAPQPVVLTLDP